MATANHKDIDSAMLYLSQSAECLEKSRIIILGALMNLTDDEEDVNYDESQLEAFESLNARLYFLSDAVTTLLKNSFQTVSA